MNKNDMWSMDQDHWNINDIQDQVHDHFCIENSEIREDVGRQMFLLT